MSWLSNEPTNVGSLLFATNYWTSVLMHGWIQIFVTRLFGDIFRLFQSCLCNYQTNGLRVRTTGILGILTTWYSSNSSPVGTRMTYGVSINNTTFGSFYLTNRLLCIFPIVASYKHNGISYTNPLVYLVIWRCKIYTIGSKQEKFSWTHTPTHILVAALLA